MTEYALLSEQQRIIRAMSFTPEQQLKIKAAIGAEIEAQMLVVRSQRLGIGRRFGSYAPATRSPQFQNWRPIAPLCARSLQELRSDGFLQRFCSWTRGDIGNAAQQRWGGQEWVIRYCLRTMISRAWTQHRSHFTASIHKGRLSCIK